jgi:hypothetical protein
MGLRISANNFNVRNSGQKEQPALSFIMRIISAIKRALSRKAPESIKKAPATITYRNPKLAAHRAAKKLDAVLWQAQQGNIRSEEHMADLGKIMPRDANTVAHFNDVNNELRRLRKSRIPVPINKELQKKQEEMRKKEEYLKKFHQKTKEEIEERFRQENGLPTKENYNAWDKAETVEDVLESLGY